MKRFIILLGIISISFTNTKAQNKDVLMTIGDREISVTEFERLYNKNKKNIVTGEITSVEDYLELFINFKLKVIEAEGFGLDTTLKFINEFNGYKQQLIQPYLTDEEKNQEMIKEAYQRMQMEVRASHILVGIQPNHTAEDTLKAFTKAKEIRRRLQYGESFDAVAKGSSDDPSVKNNGGDLGYFTAFQMVYPFETAVYNLDLGEISNSVRTRFGYHIIQKTGERDAIGEVRVAHIMLLVPQSFTPEQADEKKKQINELYHELKEGADFEEIAREYSEDKGSARFGGELPWFGPGRMIIDFEKAAFALETNGEISKPVKSPYGWHIIKRLDRKQVGTFEEMKDEITRKVGRDERAAVSRKSLINKLKKEYTLVEKLDQVYFSGEPGEIHEKVQSNDTLFAFADQKYVVSDFMQFLQSKKFDNYIDSITVFSHYQDFIDLAILTYEEGSLEMKYDELNYILKEYHDGMLLFEITDNEVWSKAANDSLGLNKFYNKNKQDYKWDERFDGKILYFESEELKEEVVAKIEKKSHKKKFNLSKLIDSYNIDSLERIKVEANIYNKGDNQAIDNYAWGVGKESFTGTKYFVTGKLIPPVVKELGETKGKVIADYQIHLEEQWIASLKGKYEVKVNKELLSGIR